MIGIKVNGTFLEIKPGVTAEVERQSPFFAINEAYKEASTPIAIRFTEANALALGFIFQYYTKREKKKVDAQIYNGNTFESKCVLVVETGKMNLNRLEDSEMTGYVMFGISEFFQLTKNKFLSDLNLGGIRNFNWTSNNPNDGSAGFWQHAHKTWTDNSIPYVFQPVRDEIYFGEDSIAEWVNKLGNNAKLDYGLPDTTPPLVPMIRLKYLLECIFNEHGFSVDFSGLNDSDWTKLLLLNLTKIDWTTVKYDAVAHDIVPSPKSLIQIDLRNHVPKKSITDFIVQLFNRYGWAPLFDIGKRTCRLVAGKELGKSGKKKDWTPYANPAIDSSFNEDNKIFGFTNDIDSNDQLPLKGDFADAKYSPPVIYKNQLPAPSVSIENRIAYVFTENRYYQVQLNDSDTYEWLPFDDNIFDDQPDNVTDNITTTISTLPSYAIQYRSSGGTDYYGYFPAMKQEYNKEMGFRTLFYHGLTKEVTADGTTEGPLEYPHASNNRYSRNGTIVAWSNTYHNIFPVTPFEDFGIVSYWWKVFLNILQAGEDIDWRLELPLHEWISFAWDDEIIIRNISYVVKSILKPLPYKGFIVATMRRLDKKVAPVVVVAPTSGTTGVYAHISVVNVRTLPSDNVIKINMGDIIVQLYSDHAGTIPYTPPTTLYVYVREEAKGTGDWSYLTHTKLDYYPVSASTELLIKDWEIKVEAGGLTSITYTFSLDPSGAVGYDII